MAFLKVWSQLNIHIYLFFRCWFTRKCILVMHWLYIIWKRVQILNCCQLHYLFELKYNILFCNGRWTLLKVFYNTLSFIKRTYSCYRAMSVIEFYNNRTFITFVQGTVSLNFNYILTSVTIRDFYNYIPQSDLATKCSRNFIR